MLSDTCIVIPAAGASTRLGTPKQLVQYEGESLIHRAARIALEAASRVVVVTGCEKIVIEKQISDLPATVVENPDWEMGIGRSIGVGVRAAIDKFPDTKGVLIHLCDLPLIDAEHLMNLCSYHSGTDADLVYTKYEETTGVPAIFGRRYFEELLLLDGDVGAKHLIRRDDGGRSGFVEFEGRFMDVDLPADIADFDV